MEIVVIDMDQLDAALQQIAAKRIGVFVAPQMLAKTVIGGRGMRAAFIPGAPDIKEPLVAGPDIPDIKRCNIKPGTLRR